MGPAAANPPPPPPAWLLRTRGPRANSLIGYGNASPGSRAAARHVNDQFPLYSQKQLKPVRLTRADIVANIEESVTLSFP